MTDKIGHIVAMGSDGLQVTCACGVIAATKNIQASYSEWLLKSGWSCAPNADRRRRWSCPRCSGNSAGIDNGPGTETTGDGYAKTYVNYIPHVNDVHTPSSIYFPLKNNPKTFIDPIIEPKGPTITFHNAKQIVQDVLNAMEVEFVSGKKAFGSYPHIGSLGGNLPIDPFRACECNGCCSLLLKEKPATQCHLCIEQGPKLISGTTQDLFIENPASRGVYAGVSRSTIFTVVKNKYVLFIQLCERNRGFLLLKHLITNDLIELREIPPPQ